MPSAVIVALDFESAAEARALVQGLGAAADHYKIGLQLLTEAGPDIARELVAAGKQVFLDLKLHEIPHAVAGAVQAAGRMGAGMVTVHASAGSAVLRAAVAAARPYPQLKVLALTVITSLSDADLPEIGLAPSVQGQVLRLARLAAEAGCHGVVASAREAAWLRELLPVGALIVCPGIQMPASVTNDQVRTATPDVTARAGASHVVIGRGITAAADPVAALVLAQAAFSARLEAPMTESQVPTLYDWLGGLPALQRLTERFYQRVTDDALLAPVFAHMNGEHPAHVAAFLGEVLGGPATYSAEHGGHAHMVRQHLNRHLSQAQRRAWVALLLDTADELGMPDDPEFRSALVGYLEWGSRLAVLNSQPGVAVDADAPMPKWGWGEVKGPWQG